MSSQILFNSWKRKRKNTIKLLRELADKLDDVQKVTYVTGLVATGTGIFGSVCVIGGFLGVPFTGGLSLAGVGFVAGGLGVGTAVGKNLMEKAFFEEVQRAYDSDREESKRLRTVFETAISVPAQTPDEPRLKSIGKDVARLTTSGASFVCEVLGNSVKETSKAFVKNASKAFLFTAILTLPADVYELVQSLKNIKEGSNCAEQVRDTAELLEEEMEHNEDSVRNEMLLNVEL